MENKTKTIFFTSLIAAMILPFSSMDMAHAATPADKTDYVGMWKIIDEQIENNEENIEQEKALLSTSALSERPAIEKRIRDAEAENTKLDQRIDELERLNILSYQLDPATQKIFDDAEQILIEKYLDDTSSSYIGPNGVSDITVDKKHRKIIVLLDIEQHLLTASNTQDVVSVVSDVVSSVNGVDIEVEFGKSVDLSCTGRTSTCNPAKAGVQIERQNSGGTGATLAFPATHSTHGSGFVTVMHEAKTVGNTILQSASGTAFGVVKTLGSLNCDCAFVKLNSGKSVENKIWLPEAGMTYPINNRVSASDHVDGMFLTFSGLSSGLGYGELVRHGDAYGKLKTTSSPGDSGAPVYKVLNNGQADVYGMLHASVGSFSYYDPWHHIKTKLSLTD